MRFRGIASSASWVCLMRKWKSPFRARCMKLAPWLISKMCHVPRTSTLQVVVQGMERFRIAEWLQTTPYLRARITLASDIVEADVELEALQGTLRELAQQVVALSPHVPRELRDFLGQVHDPRLLAYMVAAIARLQVSEGQQILEMDSVKDKFRRLITHLTHEKEILSIRHKIQTEAREEMDKAQRDYYLRQQLKAIQKELGNRRKSGDCRGLWAENRSCQTARRGEARSPPRAETSRKPAAAGCRIRRDQDLPGLARDSCPGTSLSIDQLDIPHARAVLMRTTTICKM